MNNPILSEMVARERFKDYIREAERDQLAQAMIASRPAQRFEIRNSFSNLVITVRHFFKALAHAD